MEQADANQNRQGAASVSINENPIVINYAGPDTTGQDSSRLYRWAIGLALFPLAGGVAIFLLFLITRAEELMLAGFIWLGVGVLFVTASAIMALIHAAKDWSAGLRSKRRIVLRLSVVMCLIATNFLTAGLIIYLVGHIMHP